ncbi:MAG: carbohydrate binding family 9 domain-containing protein [Tannerellaceae bacterium]|jgi:hypothetical protein|nr:carbohydrate binding family 9 domain-containing protein [Tannerellaceae bacterium]
MKGFFYTVFFFLVALCCYGQRQDTVIPFEKAYKRMYSISKVENGVPVIDGRLDEDFWTKQGEWTETFVQVSPYERITSHSPTRAKLLYDEQYIYVGVCCRDTEPEKIIRFIGNRDDNSIGDLISIAFDTYHDYRAAPEFNINTGGNKTDLIVTDKLDINRSWNAVWEGRTRVNMADSSWTAELRIPFSQLRYNRQTGDGIWGLHIRRIIRHTNEVQNWSLIPLKNNGHVFSFGMMQGMTDLPQPKGIEILPYVMGKYGREPAISGNPYRKGDRWERNAGLDMKFGLSDFTLDVTINPDFGQIELDPSVMNLTAYETFYEEKRPFFLEGKHILDFTSGSDRMFYTRRIGAAPSYSPATDNVSSFAEAKGNVAIIGALKLTGTNRRGLTIGVIQSLTARSSAYVSRDGAETREVVEPLTNYTVVRLQKNWKGNSLLGGMITSVNRSPEQPYLNEQLVRGAFTAGIDYTQYFSERLYYIDMKGMFSSLNGSREAITALQQSPVHYYQRVSASDYLSLNTSRSSLNGTGGYVKAGRRGNSRWAFSETFSWASPGFDLNTIGYLKQADILSAHTELEFRQTSAWKAFRSNTLTLAQLNQWDFSHRPNLNTLSLSWKSMLLNRYEWTVSESYGWNYIDTRKLRGGPDLRYDPYFRTTAAFNTDKARRLVFALNYVNDYNRNRINKIHTLTPALSLRLGNHVHLAGEFTYSYNTDHTQYVASIPSATKAPLIYLMGYMSQETYGLTLKMQLNLSPDVSIQFYGSPFTSTARYSDFKKAADARSPVSSERFSSYAPQDISFRDGLYTVETGEEHFEFHNPDFSFNEFRSNLVGRWEYRPGATFYFVWEHRMSERSAHRFSGWGGNLERMFGLPSVNTFMLKLNYWFNL